MSYLIESNHLCKKFGNKQALADINLRIERGRIIGLLGPNGSGKSTLIKIINGLMMPTEGEVFIDEKKPGVETKKIISYLPERTYLNEWMKVKELLDDTKVDENRLLMEVTIFADKVCVDEETVRLRSHIESTRAELLNGGSVGRKLDFIAQEMNREANTILSKANNLDVSNWAIGLKTEIEKVREQIQNIE